MAPPRNGTPGAVIVATPLPAATRVIPSTDAAWGTFGFDALGAAPLVRLHADGRLESFAGYAPERCAVLFWLAFYSPIASGIVDVRFGRPGAAAPPRGAPADAADRGVRIEADGTFSCVGAYAPDARSRALWSAIARLSPYRPAG